MSWIKVILINLIVLITFVGLIEVGTGLLKLAVGRNYLAPNLTFLAIDEDPSHPCLEMKTDTLLSHIPNHRNSCNIKGGKAVEDYVVYDGSSDKNPVLLTFGGSTTSGFYQHYADGETWPKYLSELVSKENYLVNGGVGSYSSLQEFLKFFRDGPRFEQVSIVVSLNGINEQPDYSGRDFQRKVLYPFLTETQYKMNEAQLWIDQRVNTSLLDNKIFGLIPNIKSALINLRHIDSNTFSVSGAEEATIFRPISAAERWEKNVRRLNALVSIEGAKYFVFLQPTLGLEGPQSNPPKGTNDEELLLSLSEEYLLEMRNLYKELKARCQEMSFCIDISDSVPPLGDVYADPRHHNAVGNKILADEIYKHISG